MKNIKLKISINKRLYISVFFTVSFLLADCTNTVNPVPERTGSPETAQRKETRYLQIKNQRKQLYASRSAGTEPESTQNNRTQTDAQKNSDINLNAQNHYAQADIQKNPPVQELADMQISLQTGQTYPLPANITLLTLEDEENTCIGVQNGIITAKKPGKATVKVTDKNPHTAAIFTFTITADSHIRVSHNEIKITERVRNENVPTAHKITVEKQSEYTDYKLASLPEWITYTAVTNGLKDVYTFKTNNDSFFDRSAEIIFTDMDGKPLHTIPVRQSGNYTVARKYKWVQGVKGPEPNELKKEYQSFPAFLEWYESDTTTWYNVVKLAYSGANTGYANDSYLCWAMTGANMLHWWLEQNKRNIDKYRAENNIAETKGYYNTYNRSKIDAEKSDIAQAARESINFRSAGGDVRTLFNWYIAGKDIPKNNRPSNYKEAPDYFRPVFSDTASIVTEQYVASKEQFEDNINKAFENGESIAVSYFMEKQRGRHIVTVWGAGYDKQGNVIELWIADSNVQDAKLFPKGICYKSGRPYFINFAANYPTDDHIENVIRLNSGEKEFQEYFRNKAGL